MSFDYSKRVEFEAYFKELREAIEDFPEGEIKETGIQVCNVMDHTLDLLEKHGDPLISEEDSVSVGEEISECLEIVNDFADALDDFKNELDDLKK